MVGTIWIHMCVGLTHPISLVAQLSQAALTNPMNCSISTRLHLQTLSSQLFNLTQLHLQTPSVLLFNFSMAALTSLINPVVLTRLHVQTLSNQLL